MTITSYDNRRSYAGNGSTVVFAFPPPFTTNTDVVVQRQGADGTITPLVLATDYTISGAGNPAGGTVITTVAPAAGTTLIIYRDVPLTQPVTLLDGGPLPAATANGMFDRITMWGQRLKEQIGAIGGLASSTAAGLMAATDKAKLDGIAAGAQVNAVTTVAGRTGDVLLAKADVGLGNVDNSADASKPVSTAQAAAIGLRLLASNSLSDLGSPATARTNLGATTIGTNLFTATSASSARTAIGAGVGDLVSTNNLSDLNNAATARGNLGLVIGTNVQPYHARLADISAASWVQGDMLYFNGTALTKLSPGTSGQFLKTQGSGANPQWGSIPGGGDMLSTNNLSDLANAAAARSNLGATAVGTNLFTAVDAAAARSVIGAGNGSVTSVDMTVPAGLSIAGSPITGSGTLAMTWAGVIPVANGSTGQASYAVGDILYASGTTALSKLSDVATGSALVSGGLNTAPSWGKIGLSTHVAGTLPVANGGTGITTCAVGDILYASATNVLSKLSIGSPGQALIVNGSNLPAWATASAIAVPKRQTALSGPVDANGFPNFWPANSGSLTLMMQNTNIVPLVIAIANGFGIAGQVDIVGRITANPAIILPASAISYIYVDDTGTLGSSALTPIYQYGGTLSIVNDQHTFDIVAMKMYVGNGISATAINRVFVGEAVTSGSTVTSTICYAYMGIYKSLDTAITLNTRTAFSHNIGTTDVNTYVGLKNVTAAAGFTTGQVVNGYAGAPGGGAYMPAPYCNEDRNTMSVVCASTGFAISNRTTAAAVNISVSQWNYTATACRRF
jgi:hypothetical protein